MKKICSKCSIEKDISCFNKKGEGTSCQCRDCQKQYTKKHYKDNKQYYIKKSNLRTKNLRKWIREYKANLSCGRCGENHIACIEFHHSDPKIKDLDISRVAGRGWSIERLLKEINKCEVVCSNCHRKLHYEFKKKQKQK